jgi:hypothetical protein
MARSPAPVLVTVGIELCGSVSQSSIGENILRCRILGSTELVQVAHIYACASVMRETHPEPWILGDGVGGNVP